MSAQKLQAETRTITGKAVKMVRQSGKLPATVYGKATNPLTISVDNGEFTKIFRETGETGLIELTVEGKAHPVLVHMVQTHPLTGQILHIEFHEVNLKEKVHAEIPAWTGVLRLLYWRCRSRSTRSTSRLESCSAAAWRLSYKSLPLASASSTLASPCDR